MNTIMLIIMVTISSASCAESSLSRKKVGFKDEQTVLDNLIEKILEEETDSLLIELAEEKEQEFFAITENDLKETSQDEQKKQLEKNLKIRDHIIKEELKALLKSITVFEIEKYEPLLVRIANKLSGYKPVTPKTATINYQLIDTPSYRNRFIATVRPLISHDFSPKLYQTSQEAINKEDEMVEGIELTEFIRFVCQEHKYRITQEKYQVVFDPNQEAIAIAVLVNSFFIAAEQKLNTEKTMTF